MLRGGELRIDDEERGADGPEHEGKGLSLYSNRDPS
jgi:hypothetical protein